MKRAKSKHAGRVTSFENATKLNRYRAGTSNVLTAGPDMEIVEVECGQLPELDLSKIFDFLVNKDTFYFIFFGGDEDIFCPQ